MPTRNIVVMGSSSGGIEALGEVVAGLPEDLPAAVFIVQHLASASPNYLPEMLNRNTALEAKLAKDREPIQHGMIYVAAADRHLLIDHEQMFLSQGPRENRVRPAIDPLFRSAALAHGSKSIGVILSGWLDDGTAGLGSIKQVGGLTVVQDPATALSAEMPQSALDFVDVDHCLPACEIGPLLGRLTREELKPDEKDPLKSEERAALQHEVAILRDGTGDINSVQQLGQLVPASCPDCGGPLWEVDGEFPRFRCHTGHALTARHLVAGLQEAEEQSLWVALRVMEERGRMLRRIAKGDGKKGHHLIRELYLQKAEETDEHVARLRGLLTSRPTDLNRPPTET